MHDEAPFERDEQIELRCSARGGKKKKKTEKDKSKEARMLLVEQVSVVEKISPGSKERTKDAIALAGKLSSTNCAIDGVELHFHFQTSTQERGRITRRWRFEFFWVPSLTAASIFCRFILVDALVWQL